MTIGLINSKHLLTLFTCSLTAHFCSAADMPDNHEGFYIGLFGGAGVNTETTLRQRGAVVLPAPLPLLPIDARGSTEHSSDVAVGGAHMGYEWKPWNLGSSWGLKPAAEIEGIYLGTHTPTGEMPVTPSVLGTQYVTVPLAADVFLANAVFTFQTPWSNKVLPYVGMGIGVAFVSIDGSDSANPSEPGINHFNSDPDASDSAFVLQLKAGVKSEVHKNLYLLLEYRYLSVDPTSYTFGSTNYPGVHLPTTSWQVDLGRQEYHLVVAGLQYKF